MTPRPYQSRVVDDLWAYFEKYKTGNPIIEACVGAGKSMMIAMIAKRAMQEYPDTRILVLVPSKELLVQNVEELYRVWPEANAGVYSAAVRKRQMGFDLTYATIGSIYRRAHELGRIDLIFADECHGIATSEKGMWRHLIAELRRYGSVAKVVGLTGTPFRGNGVWLTHGDDPLFTHICTRVTIRELLDLGYLSPLVTVETKTQIDVSEARTVAGDYNVSDLARIADKDELVQATCDEIVELGKHRKKWLVFSVNVEHAEHVCTALVERGVRAALVTGDTNDAERDNAIARYRSGELQCLVNVAVLTTGFNVKEIDFLVLLRATKSPVLYTQIMGRALRIADGKTDALIADFTNTIATLGPVDAIKGRVPTGGKKGEAPYKLCPNCGNPNPTSAAHCVECGHEFPPPEVITHGVHASTAAVLSSQMAPKINTYEVHNVTYALHRKEGKQDSMRVEYWHGMRIIVSEWVCAWHEPGFARTKGRQWWHQRQHPEHVEHGIPDSAEQAVSYLRTAPNYLKRPPAIIVNEASKWPELAGVKWDYQPSTEGE